VKKNDELEDMMHKSKKDDLSEDGLSTLKYEVVKRRNLPLYTHILAKLPKPPQSGKPSALKQAKAKLWQGMASMAGGLAEKVAKGASMVAQARDDKREKERNHIY